MFLYEQNHIPKVHKDAENQVLQINDAKQHILATRKNGRSSDTPRYIYRIIRINDFSYNNSVIKTT